jgi:hypothetical protein
MTQSLDNAFQLIWSYLPVLIAAIAVLVIGWVVALAVSNLARKALQRTKLDEKLASWVIGKEKAEGVDTGLWISKGIYYIIMLFVLVGFFQVLGITLITEPLNRFLNEVFEFAPRLFSAALLLLIAWIVGNVLRAILLRILNAAKIDERFGRSVGFEKEKQVPITKTLADAIYYLIFLLFLPAILNALALQGLLQPVNSMVNKILAFLPNILTAILILLIGWFLARIVQRIVTGLTAAVGVDQLSDRVGLNQILGTQRLSGVLGLIVYILIFIPVLIAALNALKLEAITQPASNMLDTILDKLPDIFAAILVLAIAYIVGKILAGLITNVLTSMGFNAILAKLGLGKEPQQGEKTPSEITGYLVLVAIMLFAITEALNILGFSTLAGLIAQFLVFSGHIILGIVIFAIGLYLANIVYNVVRSSNMPQARLLSAVARISIIVLASAIALRQMGLANEIINLAFGLLIGAFAVATAIAFGLGGREVASQKIKEWVSSIESKKEE